MEKTPQLRTRAEVVALCLEYGLMTVREAVDWADARIVELEQPPYALIEVSLAWRAHNVDVAGMLRTTPGPVDRVLALRKVMGKLAQRLEMGTSSADQVASVLYQMYLSDQLPSEDAGSDMARLEDELSLARDGIYGTVDEALADIRAFLHKWRL